MINPSPSQRALMDQPANFFTRCCLRHMQQSLENRNMDCLIGILVVGATAIACIAWAIARAASAIDDAFGEDDRA
jgi:hypothetical protein